MNFGVILWLFVSAMLGSGTLEKQVEPRTLRVCADPNYLPYSNRAGEGFARHRQRRGNQPRSRRA
jgi:hypothetical protein